MTRRRLTLLFLPAALVLLLAAAMAWLLRTETGARWAVQRLAAAVPGELAAERIEGSLHAGLRLRNLRYADDGFEVAADTLYLRLDIDLFPPALTIRDPHFGRLEIAGEPPAAPVPAASAGDRLSRLALPIPVAIDNLQGTELRLARPEQAAPWVVSDLAVTAEWSRDLRLRHAAFHALDTDWVLDARLLLAPPFTLSASLDAAIGDGTSAGTAAPSQPTTLHGRINGDLAKLVVELSTRHPEARLEGTLQDLLSVPGWDLVVEASGLAWPLHAAEPALSTGDLALSSHGTPDNYGVELKTLVRGPRVPETRVHLLGRGDRAAVRVDELKLNGERVQAHGQGQLGWGGEAEARLQLDVQRFDPSPWLTAWGAAEPARGRLSANWRDGRFEFELSDAAAPGTLGSLWGSATLEREGTGLSAQLRWRDLVWPPASQQPTLRSGEGALQLHGRPELWAAEGEAELAAGVLPPGRLRFSGGGDRESAQFRVPHARVLGGSLSGAGALRWSPAPEWSAAFQADNIDTGALFPAFPGWLGGQIAFEGAPGTLDLDLGSISGRVRGRAVEASGRLSVNAGQWQAGDFRMRSGGSTVTADGALAAPDGVVISANITSLSDFLPEASGAFSGQGRVSLAPGQSFVELEGKGQGLAFGSTAIGTLELGGRSGRDGTLGVRADNVTLGGMEWTRLETTLSGRKLLERVGANGSFSGGTLEIGLRGGLAVGDRPGGWEGRVESLRLEAGPGGGAVLTEPAKLSLGRDGLELSRACLRGFHSGRLCAGVRWRAGGERSVEGVLEDASPGLPLSLLGSELDFTQRFSGSLAWKQAPGSRPSARVALDISPGVVTADEEVPVLETGAGHFAFTVADGRLSDGRLDVPLAGGGGLLAELEAPDLSEGLESPARGRLQLRLESLEPLLRLLPGIGGTSGPVVADIGIGGTLETPALSGHLSLQDGQLTHAATGLVLEDVHLNGAVESARRIDLTGGFQAGEGHGEIAASIGLGDSWRPQIDATVRGSALTLVDVPDLNVRADPDLRFEWQPGELRVNGRITVPRARLSPRYLPTSGVSESPDFAVVAGGEPAESRQERATAMSVNGDLQLVLGDDVTVDLDRARARLRGEAAFHWSGPVLPTADGGFSIDGRISAYGQTLDVTEGRVNFAGRPADDPFLNIRAEREIFSNTQVRRAGLLVTGSLKKPVLEPYTEPMTTRERALALLVTGNDFDYEQGRGGVEVGMYIAPRLFISYGVGLFEDQNVISLRYDLGRGFGIKTTSGQRSSGADISYTIDH